MLGLTDGAAEERQQPWTILRRPCRRSIVGCNDIARPAVLRRRPNGTARVGTVRFGRSQMDAGGHQHDHTVVGALPIWWDIPGASVEWAFGDREAAYFRAAYAAFRAGVAKLARAPIAPIEPPSRASLSARLRYYGDWLGP